MADISQILRHTVFPDDSDEGVFEQGDSSIGSPLEDEALPSLSLVQKYAQSENVYERQMVTRIVQQIFQTAPSDVLAQDLTKIMDILRNLGEKDDTVVRVDLVEQIPHLASQAIEHSNRCECLKNIIGDYLIPLVVRNLGYSEHTNKAAHTALIQLMEQGLITRLQAEIQVCPAILALSSDNVKTGAITLMSKLAPLLGRDVTERIFLARFAELCSTEVYYLRKACASCIGDFCAVVGKDRFEKVLLPCYINLCQDEIWDIRKACAEMIMFVSSVCPPLLRRSELAPVFAKLLQDSSRWVQMAAFQNLGPFIATFADPPITSITYNSQGELVFVNNDGNEFLIDSSIREVRYFKFLPKQPSLNNSNSYCELEKDYGLENILCNNSDNENKLEIDDELLGNTIDIVGTNTNNDDGLSLTQSDEVIKNMFKNFCYNNDEELANEKIEQIVNQETVTTEGDKIEDNVTTSSNVSNVNVINDIQNENCDNLDSGLIKNFSEEIYNSSSSSSSSLPPPPPPPLLSTNNNNVNVVINCNNNMNDNNTFDECQTTVELTTPPPPTTTRTTVSDPNFNDPFVVPLPNIEITSCTTEEMENIKNNKVNNESEKDDDNLQLFNSYNYWYISPEMPLDLSIIEGGDRSSKGKLDDNSVVAQLEDLYANIKLTEDQNSEDDTSEKRSSDRIASIIAEIPEQDIVPQVLINNFVLMTDKEFSTNIDNDLSYHCAYSLPAVALTLKDKNWPLLKQTIERLSGDMQYRVRRTVASSLHELAEILGRDIATEHLTPIFDGFIKDLDEVRIGILKNLACFLKIIDADKRNTYLPRLQEFLKTENVSNWRFRYELATQLRLIITLFAPSDVAKYIGMLAEILLHDVSAVREAAIALITELLRYISTRTGLNSSLFLVRLVEKFAHSKRWKRRQTFALLCWKLLECKALPPEQFATEIMPHLLDLSWDPVANVRLVVAKTIAQHIIPNEYFADPNNPHFDSLGTVIRRLQADKDRDVRQHAEISSGLQVTLNNSSAGTRTNCLF